jgi:hypothetical protein
MPAFEAVLDDRETLNVLAFIKARWPPIGLRVAQATLNPGHAGGRSRRAGKSRASRLLWRAAATHCCRHRGGGSRDRSEVNFVFELPANRVARCAGGNALNP